MYIAVAIAAFGILIAVHELGHFFAAKILDVKVNEFAIGLGPKLLTKQGKETLYSLRMLPFGGFCAMEDEDLTDPRAFSSKKRWRRIAILLAGGVANLIAAFIIILIITAGAAGFTGTTITGIAEGFHMEGEHGLMAGDTIVSVNGERLYYYEDFSTFTQLARSGYVDMVIRRGDETITLERFPIRQQGLTVLGLVDGFIPNEGGQKLMVGDTITAVNGNDINGFDDFITYMGNADGAPVDLALQRDGMAVTLNSFPLRQHEYMIDGQLETRYGLTFNQSTLFRSLSFNRIEAGVGEKLNYSFYSTFNNIRLIRVSLAMLFSGAAGIQDMGGVVAIVDMMNTIGQQSPTVWDAIANIAGFTAFIGVNLAVFNLLPIPALDGGRILFIFITWAIEKISRRKLDPKYENYINSGAFILLLGLMGFFLINDVVRIINS